MDYERNISIGLSGIYNTEWSRNENDSDYIASQNEIADSGLSDQEMRSLTDELFNSQSEKILVAMGRKAFRELDASINYGVESFLKGYIKELINVQGNLIEDSELLNLIKTLRG